MKGQVESQLNQTFTTFNAISFQTQVVAGINYLFKVDVGDGKVLSVKIHKPLPHTGGAPVLMSAE